MSIDLYRVDDRLIHGQVVVGWAQPMGAGFILLVDDTVAAAAWEQDLYRMAAPPGLQLLFSSVEDGCRRLPELQKDARRGILLTADVRTMLALHKCSATFDAVNLGGIHTGPGRVACLRYVYLSDDDETHLRGLVERGVTVTAQDLPSCNPTPLDEVLRRRQPA